MAPHEIAPGSIASTGSGRGAAVIAGPAAPVMLSGGAASHPASGIRIAAKEGRGGSSAGLLSWGSRPWCRAAPIRATVALTWPLEAAPGGIAIPAWIGAQFGEDGEQLFARGIVDRAEARNRPGEKLSAGGALGKDDLVPVEQDVDVIHLQPALPGPRRSRRPGAGRGPGPRCRRTEARPCSRLNSTRCWGDTTRSPSCPGQNAGPDPHRGQPPLAGHAGRARPSGSAAARDRG